MRLAISTYLRSLKERNELDALLPDLLNAMGIIPVSRPQTGTRQFGVDLPAIGPDPDDNGTRKLFLFVLKQGDIGRSTWNSESPQSVRPSLDEVLDVYIASHLPPSAAGLPIKIVLSTSGDLKEEVLPNWSGYTKSHSGKAEFDFWGADKLAGLFQAHLLNENLFGQADRNDLRRALALIGEVDYDLGDFHKVLLRQLGLSPSGEVREVLTQKAFRQALKRINLATRLLSGWAAQDGNTKKGLIAAERAALWSWHRLCQFPESSTRSLLKDYEAIWATYSAAAGAFLEKIEAHCRVRDGLSGYTREGTLFAHVVFEVIGLLSSIGLAHLYKSTKGESPCLDTAIRAADLLVHILRNNPVSGSPPFDEHALEIAQAMSLLTLLGKAEQAEAWLASLVRRFDYTMRVGRGFPVATDFIDDLIALTEEEVDEKAKAKLRSMSWLLPTLAGWAVILNLPPAYEALSHGAENDYKTTAQLWYPHSADHNGLYFAPMHHDGGEAEAPIILPDEMDVFRNHMLEFLSIDRFEFVESARTWQFGCFGLDAVACRHFRTPLSPSYWYRFALN